MRWHCLQHVPFEGPGCLATWAQERRYPLTCTELWKGHALPALEEFDCLFILGGPMNAYEVERYSWLAPEQQFIARAVIKRKSVLGICLGAQLLAAVLGGSVSEMVDREIGWFPVELTPSGRESVLFHDFPDQFMAFHWHGDCFSIPPQAIHVARSAACDEQAFAYNDRAVGLQFHLELSQANVAAMIQQCGDDLGCGQYVQDADSMQNRVEYMPAANRLLFTLLDNLSSCSDLSNSPSARKRTPTATGHTPAVR